MAYTFTTLFPADFEDLARDLLGKELGVRFEAFGPGPDGGVDGRHAKHGTATILQAKHYSRSSLPQLRAVMKRERSAIDTLKPSRYLLATSKSLTPKSKTSFAKAIGPYLKSVADIYGLEDLNGLLRKFPDVERSTIKLWLSSTTVLERIVRSAAFTFTAISRADIESKMTVYAQNPSFDDARKKLEQTHVIIISGPPGVGKTTLAEMLAYAYIGEEWEFIAVRSLDDGFASIVDTRRQVFFFDDFLGKVALDTRALANTDSELARFIRRIRLSPNARFILTTRAYIFEEARRFSEHLADDRLDITRYLLNVDIYTRRIRARILYNHLALAGLTPAHIHALLSANALPRIVDHRNYNPRIIEAMTDPARLQSIEPASYASVFIAALDNPHQLWDIAFRTHINPACQHLLYALFFCSQYGVPLDDLRKAYTALHSALCAKYGLKHSPKDFENSVKTLEGGFTKIQGRSISFVNPSLRDYLRSYFDDIGLLSLFVSTAQKVNWAAAVWNHVREQTGRFTPADQKALAKACRSVVGRMLTAPVWKRESQHPISYAIDDMFVSDRIGLLLEWWSASDDPRFTAAALKMARAPVGGFEAWRDGRTLIQLIGQMEDDGYYRAFVEREALIQTIERAVVDAFDSWTDPDDLERLCAAADEHERALGAPIFAAMNRAIVRGVESVVETARATDSESTLGDHAKFLQKQGTRAGIPDLSIRDAVAALEERIAEIAESASAAPSPQVGGQPAIRKDQFDDTELQSLFSSLVGNRC